MNIDKMYAVIEAVLFTMGESVEVSRIASGESVEVYFYGAGCANDGQACT